ncbi:hypothetical protein [Streptomyces sp. NBC_01006]|uniref:hypothetical protein n=1 Tax=Streptomyces sp. NBC_01006 TaxID=2903716 RepID=UPI003862DCD9|nr:hypothetical protein OG509_33085 [Streptomyces sp. NBC_01006]
MLIGRNGVGKTTVLGDITRAVVHPEEDSDAVGRLIWSEDGPGSFVNVVCVTFSAFDPAQEQFESEQGAAEQGELEGWDGALDVADGQPPPAAEDNVAGVSYRYVGLAKVDELGRPTRERKTRLDLSKEFAKSVEEVVAAGRVHSWIKALEALGSDPYFFESPVRSFAQALLDRGVFGRTSDRDTALEIFSSLSSGHAIVLLTMIRVVCPEAQPPAPAQSPASGWRAGPEQRGCCHLTTRSTTCPRAHSGDRSNTLASSADKAVGADEARAAAAVLCRQGNPAQT